MERQMWKQNDGKFISTKQLFLETEFMGGVCMCYRRFSLFSQPLTSKAKHRITDFHFVADLRRINR
jgi:hypothetical protein